MHSLLCRFAAVCCLFLALTGCKKKSAVVVPAPAVAQAPVAPAPSPEPPPALGRAEVPPALGRADKPEASALIPSDAPVAGLGADLPPDGVPADAATRDPAFAAWCRKFHLALGDPNMPDADPDNDGATNREEYAADTDPTDAKSRPGIHKVLRLKEFTEVRVPMILESISGKTAHIKRSEPGGETRRETVSVGQTVGGMKVEKIVVRHETDKNGQPVDLSRVELDDPATRAKVALVMDMPARSAASYAVLSAGKGSESIKVHQGDTFHWPRENGTAFKVIDLRSDQIVVQDLDTERMVTIVRQ